MGTMYFFWYAQCVLDWRAKIKEYGVELVDVVLKRGRKVWLRVNLSEANHM
ncbi:hypothetical protein NSMM_1080002 [Nitrosomonas mobilis]|uniref:Uncharacterized protein n=1 Tax=Nitrosomonas mobilis TaxID=51642 RepID=A0A1G5SAE9_9PROT|nr:hypothetical protein NSMM_1080002 [Nitrosomonas mobilis]